MKERFELTYYLIFMALGIGGIINAFWTEFVVYSGSFDDYIFLVVVALGMTFARWLYNGKHAWQPPFDMPSKRNIIGFIFLSFYAVFLFIG
jgi:hypothetical protein